MSAKLAACFLCVSILGAAEPGDTELGKIAASMKPGTWVELKTDGFTDDLLKVQSHHILEYTDAAVWDPKSQQVLFVGQGHYSALKFIAYSAKTNSWKLMPTPSWWKGDPETGKGPIGHAYENNAIDPVRGFLFLHQSGKRLVHRCDIAKGEWTTLPEIKDASTGHGTAIAYFPERKGLVRVLGGTVRFLGDEKGTWSTIAEKLPMGPYHNYARYDPATKSVIVGGGNGSKQLHRFDAEGRFTPLAEAPKVLRISSTVTAIDPVSGDFLAIGMEKEDRGKMIALGAKTNEWRELPDAPTSEGVTVAIPEHGVVMLFRARPAKVYLYKHGK
jgi:hypothetical protein